jgi:hypothetical protein
VEADAEGNDEDNFFLDEGASKNDSIWCQFYKTLFFSSMIKQAEGTL